MQSVSPKPPAVGRSEEWALKKLLNVFVTFPGHLTPQRMKEAVYSIAGM
jgi:hypothetical protein